MVSDSLAHKYGCELGAYSKGNRKVNTQTQTIFRWFCFLLSVWYILLCFFIFFCLTWRRVTSIMALILLRKEVAHLVIVIMIIKVRLIVIVILVAHA